MKTTLQITILLFSLNLYSQSKDQKIEFIAKELGYFNSIKGAIVDYHIPNLQNFANKNDNRINKLQEKMNDVEIMRRLNKAINKTFSEKEIAEIYSFYNSEIGKKFAMSQNLIDENIKDNFIDVFEEINKIQESGENQRNQQADYLINFFEANYDKKDGFYLVTENRISNNESKFIIDENPTFEPKDIEVIKSSYNDLGNLVIDINFKEASKLKLKKITANNINKGMAIIVDRKIITMPIIFSEIPDGKLQIFGSFTTDEIKNIVNKLKK